MDDTSVIAAAAAAAIVDQVLSPGFKSGSCKFDCGLIDEGVFVWTSGSGGRAEQQVEARKRVLDGSFLSKRTELAAVAADSKRVGGLEGWMDGRRLCDGGSGCQAAVGKNKGGNRNQQGAWIWAPEKSPLGRVLAAAGWEKGNKPLLCLLCARAR